MNAFQENPKMSRSETKLDWRSLPHAFQILLARQTLDLATRDHLVLAAHALLDFGLFTPALGELISFDPLYNVTDANEVFAKAINELNVQPMTTADAHCCWYETRLRASEGIP